MPGRFGIEGLFGRTRSFVFTPWTVVIRFNAREMFAYYTGVRVPLKAESDTMR
jgi:hypothetical protein